jgi:asparagine synthetase B (glutamine-hydrolysing)
MCGIAGWLGTLPNSEKYAYRMAQALRHRGPDAHRTLSWPEATLIHTRLSIIDLSPTGAQPMANEDRTVWTVFNGEIYNHRELRRQLEARQCSRQAVERCCPQASGLPGKPIFAPMHQKDNYVCYGSVLLAR